MTNNIILLMGKFIIFFCTQNPVIGLRHCEFC